MLNYKHDSIGPGASLQPAMSAASWLWTFFCLVLGAFLFALVWFNLVENGGQPGPCLEGTTQTGELPNGVPICTPQWDLEMKLVGGTVTT